MATDEPAKKDLMMDAALKYKYDLLKQKLAAMGKVAVGFSAGTDSTLLLSVAHEVLGDGCVAFSATSPAFSKVDTDQGIEFCTERGIKQVLFDPRELEIEGFDRNPADRCYLCKLHLFETMKTLASEMGIDHVLEGSNVDDLSDYRPGRKAVEELGIECPLLDCGFTKQDVRDLSRELGLPTWNKPSAACLYSRFAYGDLLSAERLGMVEQAEEFIRGLGFDVVRVRVHGDLARVEVAPDDIERAASDDVRGRVVDKLTQLGFKTVTLDMKGYSMGSMNEALDL